MHHLFQGRFLSALAKEASFRAGFGRLQAALPAALHAALSAALAAPAAAAPQVAAPPRPVIEFVAATSTGARTPDTGHIVLDLAGLESAEAALTLANSWRQRYGNTRPLTCFVRAASREEAAQALRVLSQTESPPCTRVLLPR